MSVDDKTIEIEIDDTKNVLTKSESLKKEARNSLEDNIAIENRTEKEATSKSDKDSLQVCIIENKSVASTITNVYVKDPQSSLDESDEIYTVTSESDSEKGGDNTLGEEITSVEVRKSLDQLRELNSFTSRKTKERKEEMASAILPSQKGPVRLLNKGVTNSTTSTIVGKSTNAGVTKKILNPLTTKIDKDEELIAVLEEDNAKEKSSDNVEHFHLVEVISESKETKSPESQVVTSILTKEEEKKLAMEQISQFAKRNRKRKVETKQVLTPSSEIVTALASEWDEEELPSEENVEHKKEDKDVTKPNQVQKKVIKVKAGKSEDAFKPVIEPFRRTRVVKKKIIWDPDAPETQFSYASLVQSSSANKSQHQESPTKKSEKKETSNESSSPQLATQQGRRGRSKTPSTIGVTTYAKKKKTEQSQVPVTAEITVATKKNSPKVEKQNKPETAPKKGTSKGKSNADSWGYVYKQRNEDSMIIRRRSNSSYSSTTSPRRLSLDQPSPQNQAKSKIVAAESTLTRSKTNSPASIKTMLNKDKNVNEITVGRTTVLRTRKSEFAVPETKKAKKEEKLEMNNSYDSGKSEDGDPKLSAISSTSEKREDSKIITVSPLLTKVNEKLSEVTVRKLGNITQIILSPKQDKIQDTFTVSLMNSVVKQLAAAKEDNSCKVVFITSAGPNFCQGVDFIPLIVGTAEKRKNAATELAISVKNFLSALASFSKPLLAGVNGNCCGIGVTMLPLFDIVISSDKSVYSTSYAKIGQIPEGYCILNLTHNVRHNFKIKLLWLCEKVNPTEAALSGLISKLSNPAKIQSDTHLCAKKVAEMSQQTYKSMKTQRHKHELSKILSSLAEEQKILIQQWSSTECQEKFKHFLQTETWS